MNVYRNPLDRVMLGIAAVAMAAIMIALGVIMPATQQAHGFNPSTLSQVVAPGLTETEILPMRIEVVGVRKPRTVSMQPGAPDLPAGKQG